MFFTTEQTVALSNLIANLTALWGVTPEILEEEGGQTIVAYFKAQHEGGMWYTIGIAEMRALNNFDKSHAPIETVTLQGLLLKQDEGRYIEIVPNKMWKV
jgi:hypothetical protein